MNVSAVIVTRGDVALGPIIDTLPFDDIVVWDNSVLPDVKVLGRYIGMFRAKHDIVYVQDDDVLVSDPQAIVDALDGKYDCVVCNMPQEFRHDGYVEHSLVGFGAAMHREAAWIALQRWLITFPDEEDALRCCDIPVTALMNRILVDVPKENLPWATAENRMYKQQQHVGERARVLKQVLKVRDGGN